MTSLFPDTEPAEELIEHVFDVDAPRDPADCVCGAPDVLGTEFDGRRIFVEKRFDIRDGVLEALPVPRLGQHGIGSIAHRLLGALGDALDQPVEAFSGHGGNRESSRARSQAREISFGFELQDLFHVKFHWVNLSRPFQ